MEQVAFQATTPDMISAAAGSLLSLVLAIVPLFWPQFSEWWKSMDDKGRQGVNVIALLVITIGMGLLSCFGAATYVECTGAGLLELFQLFLAAATGNVVTFGTLKHILR